MIFFINPCIHSWQSYWFCSEKKYARGPIKSFLNLRKTVAKNAYSRVRNLVSLKLEETSRNAGSGSQSVQGRLKMLLVWRRNSIYKRNYMVQFCTSPKFFLTMTLAQIALQIYSKLFFSLINDLRHQSIPIAYIQLLKGVICRELQYCFYFYLTL